MTPVELNTSVVNFCNELFETLGKPKVTQHVKGYRPLTVSIGVTIPKVEPDIVKAAINGDTMKAAILSAFPYGGMVRCSPKSIVTGKDGKTVIFDVVFYSVNVSAPDNLTP